MKNIADRLIRLNDRIRSLEKQYQRPEGSVHLLAVSKTWPVSSIREAHSAGQRLFGENYVQEAVEKIQALAESRIEWHYIGPVQANKTRLIAEHFHWCHSIDRLKIAQRLDKARETQPSPLNVCVQVNISREPSKSGVDEKDVIDFCKQVADLPGLKLRGLMAMPAPADTLDSQRAPFRKMRDLQDRLQAEGFEADTLSMGTTQDLEAAIAEGSTLVRVGTAIFGERIR